MAPHAAPQAIYVVGAQCSGKTSLVMGLREELCSLPLTTITEAARDVLRGHNFTRDDIRNDPLRCLELQRLILQAQRAAESNVPTTNLLLSDRSGVDPIVYAAKYGPPEGSQELMSSQAWTELREKMASALVIVCEPVVEWLKDDGTRLMPESLGEWMDLHRCFCDVLAQNDIGYHLLRSNVTSARERISFVMELFRERSGMETCRLVFMAELAGRKVMASCSRGPGYEHRAAVACWKD